MLKQLLHTFIPGREGAIAPLHKRTGEKLEFSELRYRRLFETAQDGILILDADSGNIADANPFLRKLLGYSEEELLGKKLWEIGVLKDIVDSKKAFHRLQTRGYIRYKDLPLETKNGRIISVEFISNLYMVGYERVIQCNIRDITDRKKIEGAVKSRTQELEQLSRAQEKTKRAMLNVMEDLEAARTLNELEKVKDEAMLGSIGEGLIAVDNNRKVIIINKAAENLLGWKATEILGQPLIKVVHLEDESGHDIAKRDRPIQVSLTSHKTITTTTLYYVGKDKKRFPVSIVARPIILKGETIGAIEVFRDITREIEVDRAKSEFVTLASHQLRTPLGVIKWYLEALESEEYIKRAPDTIRGSFDEIYKSNERVLSLVRDLLSISRIEEGRVRNVPKSVNITQQVREIVEQMQIIAHKKDVSLRLSIPHQKTPPLNIDIIRFHEVIQNLIGNAIEYTMGAGRIDITVKKLENTLLIKIRDTGIGISQADQKKLFTKFFRAEKAIKHNPEGSGLGLYVVRSYVKGWGGQISVRSAEGKGSTFTISLPIAQKRMHEGG